MQIQVDLSKNFRNPVGGGLSFATRMRMAGQTPKNTKKSRNQTLVFSFLGSISIRYQITYQLHIYIYIYIHTLNKIWSTHIVFPSTRYFYEIYRFDHHLIQLPWKISSPGALLSVSVVLSNSAAVLLSVAFVNMLKSHWVRSYELGVMKICG